MSKIKFKAHVYSSYCVHDIKLRIKVSIGSTIIINWGDGNVVTHPFQYEDEMVFEYRFFPNLKRKHFHSICDVEISGNCPNCHIIGFSIKSADIDVFDFDVSACPELEDLDFYKCESINLDLSRNTALKKLDCSYNYLKRLDLSHNTALKELICCGCGLQHLSLANNFELEYLNCEYNGMEKIFIYYAPQLCKAEFEEGNNIDDETRSRIQQILEENNIWSRQ